MRSKYIFIGNIYPKIVLWYDFKPSQIIWTHPPDMTLNNIFWFIYLNKDDKDHVQWMTIDNFNRTMEKYSNR